MLTYLQPIFEWGKKTWTKDLLVGVFLLLWAGLILRVLVVHPDLIPMPLVNQDTDFFNTHFPVARYVHDSILRDGILPLWNASFNSGQPFAGDPLSGYWYLPNWLVFWQPQPWMFDVLFGIHLLWSGLGLYFLLKKEGVRPLAAGFAGAVWMAAPKTIGYIGGGQVSLVFALAWMPWLLMAFRRAARTLQFRPALLAGGCLAVLFLADVRWGFYSGLLALAYAAAGAKFQRNQILQVVRSAAIILGVFGVLTAGLTLPMLEFMGLSRRSALSLQDLGAFAVRPEAFLGIIAPQFGMIYEYVVYFGWVTLILAGIGWMRRRWFWAGALLTAALFSLGTNFFLFPLAVNLLPGLGWLRVPGRAWFIVAFCAAALAGWGLDALLSRPAPDWARKWITPLAAGTAAISVMAWAGVVFFVRLDPVPPGLAVLLIVPALTIGFILLALKSRLSRWILAILFLLLAAADLLSYGDSQLTAAGLPDSEATRWLEAQPGSFRVYSPDGSLTMPNRLQMANGYNPLHLRSYAEYLGQASRIQGSGYSVSLPDIYIDANTPPETAAAAAHPDTAMLGILNVRYLAARFPLQATGLELVQTISSTYIYQNALDRGRTWLEGGTVSVLSWSPDRIQLESDGPAGMLTLSEIVAPGWQVVVDGQPALIETTLQVLRGVRLDAGRHQVIFQYQPANLFAGSAIAGAGWLAFLFFLAAGLPLRWGRVPAWLLKTARWLLSNAFPERQIFTRNFSILQKLLLLAGMTAVFYLPGLLLNPGGFIGFDWYSFFGIGRIAPFYPPWTGAVVSVLNWPLLVGLGLAAFSLAALQRSVHPLSLAAAFFCLPVLWTIFLGQLEGLVTLGLVGLPWLAPLALLKPQVSIFAFGTKKQYLAALLAVLVLSTMIYGPWWLRMLNAELYYAEGRYVQNIGLGWWGLPIFLATVWFSRGDIDMLMLSGCFITPHLIPYNLMPVVPALSRLRPLNALVGLGLSWLPIIIANSQGNWGWWTGWLFPAWVWANLAAQRYPQWKRLK